MPKSDLKTLLQHKARLARLERAVAAEQQAALKKIHADLGFGSRDELIDALLDLGRPKRTSTGDRGAKGRGGRKARTVVTPELRSRIEAAVRAGGSGQVIADQFGVSLPTVQNIKRAAGLTRKGRRRGK